MQKVMNTVYDNECKPTLICAPLNYTHIAVRITQNNSPKLPKLFKCNLNSVHLFLKKRAHTNYTGESKLECTTDSQLQ